jgi:integrase
LLIELHRSLDHSGLPIPLLLPCGDVERHPERRRERFLSPTELQRLGQVLTTAEVSASETIYAVAAFRILLVTGCRLSEIQRLEWRYVDLQQRELRLPDSKTGAKTVHLGDAAVALLEAPPRVKDNPYVIVGKEKTHPTDLQHAWRRIRKAAGLDDVRIHDLRHNSGNRIIPSTEWRRVYFLENRGVLGT